MKTQKTPTICRECGNAILETDLGSCMCRDESVVCGSCVANARIRDVAEMRCLACGSKILLFGSGEWICLSENCTYCSPDFDRKENIEPLGKLFIRVIKHDPGLFLGRPVPIAVKRLFRSHQRCMIALCLIEEFNRSPVDIAHWLDEYGEEASPSGLEVWSDMYGDRRREYEDERNVFESQVSQVRSKLKKHHMIPL